jgi:predicted nucleic acid-binding protein
MIVVLDANTWVSALARPKGPPGRVVDAFLDARFSVATTEHLWSEVLRALSYDRVKRLFERGHRGPGSFSDCEVGCRGSG